MLKTGRLPRAHAHVARLTELRRMCAMALPQVPVALNNAVALPAWVEMFLNDQLGCCTAAGLAHLIQLVTRDAQGVMAQITDAQVLSAYEAFGYVPGRPETDRGVIEQDVLRWFMQTGFPMPDGSRMRAQAVFECNPKDTMGLCETIMEFGAAYIGFEVPSGFMEDLPPLWVDQPTRYGTIEGGHCVLLHSFDRSDPSNVVFGVTTWGTNRQYMMRQDFLNRYVDEAYGVFLPPWIETTGRTPYGLDAAELVALGGEIGQAL